MSNYLILVVDDNQQNMLILEKMLAKVDYNIGTCSSGQEALMYLESKVPDLILLDIAMPEMDGYELCRLIKENERLKEIPVIFVTGQSDENSIVKGFETGASDYITKPFKSAELFARVKLQLELKTTLEKLEKAKKESEQIANSKDKFISVISHDLRGPFQGILGLSGMLRSESVHLTEEEKQQFIDVIDSSLNGVYKLIENLLSWTLIEDGKYKLFPELIKVHDLIDEQLNLYRILIKDKEINIITEIPNELQIIADRNGISTVLRNIISNAIKFTPKQKNIKISASFSNNEITFSILDSGKGISKEMISNFFDKKEPRLRTMPGTNSERGSGLGLILCRELVLS